LHWLAWLLVITGRRAEAAAAALRTAELEPLSPFLNARSGHILAYAGYPEEGRQLVLRALELDPRFGAAYESLAVSLSILGRYEEAVKVLEQALDLPGSTARLFLPLLLAVAGRESDARAALSALNHDPRTGRMPIGYAAVFPAWAYAALGDLDEAFAWFEHGVRERLFTMLLLDVDPGYSTVRSDSRFAELRRRVGLPG
jgi:tetratricopeptide (TPR) repeat protein